MKIYLSKSSRDEKKWMVEIDGKTVHFGAKGAEDFTMHKDPLRKAHYITRHQKRENWKFSGIKTAGFWSRWLLWNKPSIKASIQDIEEKFDVDIIKE